MGSDTMLTQRWENYVTKQTSYEIQTNFQLTRGLQDNDSKKWRRKKEIKRVERVIGARGFEDSLNPPLRNKTRRLLKILQVNQKLSNSVHPLKLL